MCTSGFDATAFRWLFVGTKHDEIKVDSLMCVHEMNASAERKKNVRI